MLDANTRILSRLFFVSLLVFTRVSVSFGFVNRKGIVKKRKMEVQKETYI